MWSVRYSALQKFLSQQCLSRRSTIRSSSTKVNVYNSFYGKKQELKVGTELEGFVVQEIAEIHEFNISAATLKHEVTGAEYLHLFRNDNNNTFCVGFRTTPTDSTGLPHILEHTTLCGSVRYPCRDPFFKMLNRSLATFMNALTGPDYTMYPFATQNPHDFNNLLSVYLDAVFNPRLREVDFMQEGWRLEHEDLNNPDSNIIFKGVVFNEMKGVFSDPQSVFGQTLLNSLLPSHTYGHISGGDPSKIPLLTHEDLKAFHKKFYNPANAKFYSYGNFPLADHLTYINQNYLCMYEDKELSSSGSTLVPLERRWSSPCRKHISCRIDPMAANPKKQSTIAVGVLLNDICDIKSGFDWNVLSELLVSGPNSAFYKTLVEPQIGAGFAPCTGYESQIRDTFFSVGLQGLAPEDFDRVVEIFDKTIKDVVDVGFDSQHVEAVLHGIELGIKHEVSNFGLGILFGIAPLWNHDGNIIEALRVNQQLKDFRQRLKDNPRYLQEVLENKVKGNSHKLILTMSPDDLYEQRLAEEEMKLLTCKINNLSDDDKINVLKWGQELLAEQTQNQDTSCLPTLRIDDLSQETESISLKDTVASGIPVQSTAQPTNGLVYFRGILNISALTSQQKVLLPLFATTVTKMGTKKSSFRELDQKINLKTGGISFAPHLKDNLHNLQSHEEGLLFSSYSLDRNMNDMYSIITEIFNDQIFEDVKRFETLTRMSATNLANSIIDRGHMYSMLSAGSLVNGSVLYKENYSGVSYVDEIRRIAQLNDLSPIMEELKKIASIILNKNHLRSAVNYADGHEAQVIRSLEAFMSSLPGTAGEVHILSPVEDVKHQHNAIHHVLPIPVNFAAKAIQTVAFTHRDYAPLMVLAKLLSAKYLHPHIREKGGAYGSGAMQSMSGTFFFFSYRDPNSSVTLNVFDGAHKWLSDGKFTQQDLEEAMLGVFQKVDLPVPPGQKGLDCFLYGITDSVLQEHRQQLMSVTKDDLVNVSEKYLSDNSERVCGRALLGPTNPDIVSERRSESWLIKAHE